MSIKRKSSGKFIATEALSLGLSGIGMLVVGPDTRISALQRGETIQKSWSNVGKHLDRAAAKQADERAKKADK